MARPKYIKVKLDAGAYEPVRAYETDAGLDIMTPIDVIIPARQSVSIVTGVHVEIPAGYAGFLKSKSGLMEKGVRTEGTIDAGYTGSIIATVFNDSDWEFRFHKGNKITQLVLIPIWTPQVELVEEIDGGDRGDNGFGSTGE